MPFPLACTAFYLFFISTALTQGGCCSERNRCCWLRGGEDGPALEALTRTLTLTHRRPSAPFSAHKMGMVTPSCWRGREGALPVVDKKHFFTSWHCERGGWGREVGWKCSYVGRAMLPCLWATPNACYRHPLRSEGGFSACGAPRRLAKFSLTSIYTSAPRRAA